MGVLYDYFRAADDEAVVDLMKRIEGCSPAGELGDPLELDALDFKGLDPAVRLRSLVSLARPGELPALDELVWSGSEEGPWVSRLDQSTRDTLAALPEESLAELATRWGRSAELGHPQSSEELLDVVADLVGLARRSAEAGEQLYCWICL